MQSSQVASQTPLPQDVHGPQSEGHDLQFSLAESQVPSPQSGAGAQVTLPMHSPVSHEQNEPAAATLLQHAARRLLKHVFESLPEPKGNVPLLFPPSAMHALGSQSAGQLQLSSPASQLPSPQDVHTPFTQTPWHSSLLAQGQQSALKLLPLSGTQIGTLVPPAQKFNGLGAQIPAHESVSGLLQGPAQLPPGPVVQGTAQGQSPMQSPLVAQGQPGGLLLAPGITGGMQVNGVSVQGDSPQTFGVPPPPQVSGAVHPQSAGQLLQSSVAASQSPSPQVAHTPPTQAAWHSLSFTHWQPSGLTFTLLPGAQIAMLGSPPAHTLTNVGSLTLIGQTP
jgi:hypothetical protein